MTIRNLTIFLSIIICASALPSRGQSAQVDITGEWVNVDQRTRGITRVVIAEADRGFAVRAFGRCHPEDCDWGWTAVTPLGESVEDHSFNSGFAVWKPGFASKYVTLMRTGERLAVEIVTTFHDNSGRANFRRVEILARPNDFPSATRPQRIK